jgi:hypothetical protein
VKFHELFRELHAALTATNFKMTMLSSSCGLLSVFRCLSTLQFYTYKAKYPDFTLHIVDLISDMISNDGMVANFALCLLIVLRL